MEQNLILKVALLSSLIVPSVRAGTPPLSAPTHTSNLSSSASNGFYLGLGLGIASAKGNMSTHNMIRPLTGDGTQSDLSSLEPAFGLSFGYEKTLEGDYVLGLEGRYIRTNLSDSKDNSFDKGLGPKSHGLPVKDTVKVGSSYGVNFSLGRQVDRLTPYVKLGIVSTDFTTNAQSPGKEPTDPTTSFNGTQHKRVFGMASGIGIKYALTPRLDLVTEGMAHFYRSFKTNNFSTVGGDSHTMKVNPCFLMFLVGLNLKF
jgi:opacity protein-like surface antigen